MELRGKVVMITGASRGIGRALALELARQGACLSMCARAKETLEQARQEAANCSPRGGESVFAMPCDAADFGQIASWVTATVGRFGQIDVLINNASLLGERRPISEYPQDVWEQVLRANATGPFLVAKAVLRASMLRQKSGLIINISSGVGRVGKAKWGAYAASKFALEGLSQVMAQELSAQGIISVSVNPEATRTPMRAEAYPQEDPATLKTPDDFARTLVQLIKTITPADSGRSFDYKELQDR